MLAIMWLFFVILGIVQGITEFIPISSSGHLVLLQVLWRQPALSSSDLLLFDAVVHFATLVAVLWVFRSRVILLVRALFSYLFETKLDTRQRSQGIRQFLLIALGTLPTALIGLLLREQIESSFSSATTVGVNLLLTGSLLLCASRYSRQRDRPMHFLDAVVIGTMQGFAIFPGISRSGFTIGTGLLMGLRQDLAAEYSFLLAIPAIMGALLSEIIKLQAHVSASLVAPYMLGGIIALATGIISLRFLLRVLKRGRLHYFAYYCFAIGIFALLAAKYILA
jgi:undecaprenyl-diphosphatase